MFDCIFTGLGYNWVESNVISGGSVLYISLRLDLIVFWIMFILMRPCELNLLI